MNDVSQATPARPATVNAQIVPAGTLDLLSRNEIARLRDATSSGLHALLRSCSLAVLTSGAMQDSARAMLDQYPDFDIQVLQQDRGVKLDLKNAPAQAFVDGKIIRGTNELLFAVVRDIVYVSTRLNSGEFDLSESLGGQAEHHTRNAAVTHQQVRADTDYGERYFLGHRAQESGEVFLVGGLEQRFRQATGAKPGDLVHLGIGRDAAAQAGKPAAELLDQGLATRHDGVPPSSLGSA